MQTLSRSWPRQTNFEMIIIIFKNNLASYISVIMGILKKFLISWRCVRIIFKRIYILQLRNSSDFELKKLLEGPSSHYQTHQMAT